MKITLTLLWILFIVIGIAFIAIPDIFKMYAHADKFLHILFSCLFILGPTLYFDKKSIIFSIAACIILSGFGLELIQSLLPDRKAEILDILSNLCGVTLGLIIGFLIKSGYRAGHSIKQHQ